jgi:hypothetical protein
MTIIMNIIAMTTTNFILNNNDIIIMTIDALIASAHNTTII